MRLPDGALIRTPQSTTNLHYLKSEVDALLSTISSQHNLDQGVNSGLHTLYASQIAALDARLIALEATVAGLSPLSFKGSATATPVEVHQLQVAPDLQWAFYPSGNILWIEQDPPLDPSPY